MSDTVPLVPKATKGKTPHSGHAVGKHCSMAVIKQEQDQLIMFNSYNTALPYQQHLVTILFLYNHRYKLVKDKGGKASGHKGDNYSVFLSGAVTCYGGSNLIKI